MDYNNIYFYFSENEKEVMFRQKCLRLLNFYCIDRILEEANNQNFYTKTFENDYLSNIDIDKVLVKRYYLCSTTQSYSNQELNSYYNVSNINQLDELINININIKNELLKSYLENIRYSNAHLIKQKLYNDYPETVISTLNAIEDYYSIKKTEDESIVYKKSYY